MKILLCLLVLIGSLQAGWMNVDSINIKQKWRNKKLNTDALLFVKSADSLLDTANIYDVNDSIGVGINTPLDLFTVNGDIRLSEDLGLIMEGDTDGGSGSSIYLSNISGFSDAFWSRIAGVQSSVGYGTIAFLFKDSSLTYGDNPKGLAYDTAMSICGFDGTVIVGNSCDHFSTPAKFYVDGTGGFNGSLYTTGMFQANDSVKIDGSWQLHLATDRATQYSGRQHSLIATTSGHGTLADGSLIIQAGSWNDDHSIAFYGKTTGNLTMEIYSDSLIRMLTDSIYMGSNVNIESKLTVYDPAATTGAVLNSEGLTLNRSTGSGYLNFQDGAGANNWQMNHDNSGNVLQAFSSNGVPGIFQVGSYSDRSVFAVNTTTENVGIGTTSPQALLNIYGGASGATADATVDEMVIENNGNTGITILTPDANYKSVIMGSPTNNYAAGIRWNYSNGQMDVGTFNSGSILSLRAGNGSEYQRITSTGDIGIGLTVPTAKLHVNGTGKFQNQLVIEEEGLKLSRSSGSGYVAFDSSNNVEAWQIRHEDLNNELRAYSKNYNGIFTIARDYGSTPFFYLNTNSGRSAFGTSTTQGLVHFFGAPELYSDIRGVIVLNDSSSLAEGNGGGIMFSGNDGITPNRAYAGIAAYKANATSGNYDAQLHFQTRVNGGTATTKMILDQYGNLGLSTTPSGSYDLEVNSGTSDDVALFGSTDANAKIVIQDNASTQYIVTQNSLLSLGSNGSYSGFGGNLNIDASGNTSIGTSSAEGKLDVSFSRNTGTPSICFGADITAGSTSRTTSTSKAATMGAVHYDNTEEPICAVYVTSESGVNNINFGGGSSYLNCASYMRFYTATSATAVTGTEAMTINSIGNVGIGDNLPGYKLTVNGIARSSTVHTDSVYVNDDRIRIANSNTPASASAAGTAGTICWDANYIYVCIATNTWKRTAISTW